MTTRPTTQVFGSPWYSEGASVTWEAKVETAMTGWARLDGALAAREVLTNPASEPNGDRGQGIPLASTRPPHAGRSAVALGYSPVALWVLPRCSPRRVCLGDTEQSVGALGRSTTAFGMKGLESPVSQAF